MKAFLTACALALCLSNLTSAQSKGDIREVRGNGKIVNKTFSVSAFNTIEIEHFPANVMVEISEKTPFLEISIDENLLSKLSVESENNVLKLQLTDPDNKDFWVSKATINVKISTKNLKSLRNGSNGDVTVNGLKGSAFDLINDANGNITLKGTSGTFSLISRANGNINAEKFEVKTAYVVADANATIRLNTQKIQAATQAFAKIENVNVSSTLPVSNVETSTSQSPQLITLNFVNGSASSQQFTLISYAPGESGNETNGFSLAPNASKEKQYVAGTKVYLANKQQIDLVMSGKMLQGKPLLTVQDSDEGRKVVLSGK